MNVDVRSQSLLSDRKGLVVGIANEHSIAYGCARMFRNCGAELAVTWLNDKARPHVEPLGRELSAALMMPLDVERSGEMEAVFDAVRARWGRLDFLLHSIAYAPAQDLHGRVADTSREGFARAMDISCHSFMRMARLAEPLMDNGGTLLTMSYLGANEVVAHYGVMGPVKAALEASVRYLATELGPRGIRVNAVSPGPIKTRAASGIPAFDALFDEARRRAPLAREVEIDDVGSLCAFLVSDAAQRDHRRRPLRRRRLPHPCMTYPIEGTIVTHTLSTDDLEVLRNRTFDEIAVGERASIERTLTAADIQLFAAMSGDINPQHIDAEFAASTRYHGVIAHGMWGAALISAVLGTRLPGPGTVYAGQTLKFHAPVRVGDTLKISVTVTARDEAKQRLVLDCNCTNQDGKTVISGEATVLAPTERIERPRGTLPQVRIAIAQGDDLVRLVQHVRPLGRIRVAVVHPCDDVSLSAAIDAHAAGLIEPVLVGPRARIEAVAQKAGLNIAGLAIDDVPHSHAAAARGVELAVKHDVDALMKGSLHTDELMGAVVASPLRTARRMSHCFLMQTPAYPRPFIITDAAVNIAPTLPAKADIVRNAIDLAHAFGVARPRVAILAAVETVNPDMPATLDAAALCKMADRGQIEGAVLDGPLAFDNAVSAAAARTKGIVSDVAGAADILVVPDLESGNMLAKQLMYLGGAASAGIVVGARVPIVLTSRADSRESRIASCAVALVAARRNAQPGAITGLSPAQAVPATQAAPAAAAAAQAPLEVPS